ncbi:hypothetical protein V5O48_014382 [Marasmius crinis-equi]|uniref:Uncharacterized protein n=1 Tax=Marasmius crinis-equi TaxID=585013 RepID=A0ABR3EXG6_9AGAR
MKRRRVDIAPKTRNGNSISNKINLLTLMGNDDLVQENRSGGSAENEWTEISFQREGLFNSSGHGTTFDNVPIHDTEAADDKDWHDEDFQMAIGDEGAINSNAGGEFSYQTLLHNLLKDAPASEKQTKAWEEQMPGLVDGYLHYQASGYPDSMDNHILQGECWQIWTMDFTEYIVVEGLRHVRGAKSINESLAYHGLLGGSPEQPSIAFRFEFLEAFCQIHRVCPRYTLNGLSRTLTNINGIQPWRINSGLRMMLIWPYNGMFNPTSTLLLAVIPMTTSFAINTSLKMVDSEVKSGIARLDTRRLHHPRWLDADNVDQYKDEVATAHRTRKPAPSAVPLSPSDDPSSCDGPEIDNDTGMAWLNENELQHLKDHIDPCVEQWKAAGPDSNKKMYSFFAISGIFLSVCCHGHVLVICDMRRSGELMKYLLANVKALLDRYGKDLGLGYGIMCAFYKTLLRSRKLGDQVVACQLRGVVPAFHGHAHNRKCQVSWHPMYIKGVGLKDFEECERTFSDSNHLAASTRLSTELHGISNFIYQNYRQALERLAADEPLFREFCEQWNVSEEDCEQFLRDERDHFSRDFVELSPDVVARLDYVELLQRYDKHKKIYEEADKKYRGALKDPKVTQEQTNSLITRARNVLEQYTDSKEQLCDFENHHSFVRRWEPGNLEYRETLRAMVARQYRQALEQLERLVVQRLLELTKLNMSGVGYRQREKIAQALRARSKAIQNALDKYNEAARAVDPPRPTLEWRSILDMATLADFNLLKNTHLDLLEVGWAQPQHRECMKLYFGLERARKEIKRLNVEIPRLLTSMIDDYADHFHAKARAVQSGKHALAEEIQRRMRDRAEINCHIAIRLVQTSELNGFSGNLAPGYREGRDPAITNSAPLAPWAVTTSPFLAATTNTGTMLLQYIQEETMCLRLYGRTERQWLKWRGVPERDLDMLVEKCRVFREHTIERYHKMSMEGTERINKLHKLILHGKRNLEGYMIRLPHKQKLRERYEKWKAQDEAERDELLDKVSHYCQVLQKITWDPQRIRITRRAKVKASEDVRKAVDRMIVRVNTPDGV